eukprot:g2087.t1
MESGKSKERKQAIGRGINKSLNDKVKNKKKNAPMGYGELQALVEMLRDGYTIMKKQVKDNGDKVKQQKKIIETQKKQIIELRASLATVMLRTVHNPVFNVSEFAGHKQSITCMCLWSSVIITGSKDRTLKAWGMMKYAKWKCLGTMHGHTGAIADVCSMGIYVASVASDGLLKVWDPKSANFDCLATISKHTASANCVIYHAKQKHLASCGSDGYIYVINPQNAFDLEHKIKTDHGGIFSACLFGMNYVCSGHTCGTINVWDVSSSWLCNHTIKHAHDNPVTAMVEWRGHLASICKDVLKIWKPKDWEVIGEGFGHRKGCTDLVCSPKTGDYPYNTLGMLTASCNDGYVYYWDVRTLIFHRSTVHASLRMKHFFRMTADNFSTMNVEQLNQHDKEPSIPTPITCMLWSANGQILYTGDRKTRVKGWGGFSAMYTSIPIEEFDAEEDRIKQEAEAKEEMLRQMRSGKAIADQVSAMKIEDGSSSKK